MAHTAKSLFDLNIESAQHCLTLYSGLKKLGSGLEISWLLRSAIVFSVSALDSYFHDKIKYRAGRYRLNNLPAAMETFEIPLGDLRKWERATRKGNVIRNWLTDYYAVRPLQRREDIADALKVVGIEKFWSTIEPNQEKRAALIDELRGFVDRRNKIAHEGDRQTSRVSGKRLRPISRDHAAECIDFVITLVGRIEKSFPA
jgi:hypothetical protein